MLPAELVAVARISTSTVSPSAGNVKPPLPPPKAIDTYSPIFPLVSSCVVDAVPPTDAEQPLLREVLSVNPIIFQA